MMTFLLEPAFLNQWMWGGALKKREKRKQTNQHGNMVQRKFSSTVNVKAKCLLTFLITLRQRQHICVSTERVYEPVSAGQLAAPEALVAFSSQKKILVGQSSKQEGWGFSPIRSWGVFNTGSVKSCIKHWLWLHRQMAPVLPSTSSTFNKR